MRLLLLASALVVTGCSSPVVGKWQSDQKLKNGRRNSLTVVDDQTAEASIYATPSNDPNFWILFEFEADWEDKGDEFEFDMECQGDRCQGDGDDFSMDCEVIEEDDGGEKLDCKGSDKWEAYPFDWERDGS